MLRSYSQHNVVKVLKVLKVLKYLKVLKVFVYHADTLLTSQKKKQAVGGFRLLLVFTFYGLYFIIFLYSANHIK